VYAVGITATYRKYFCPLLWHSNDFTPNLWNQRFFSTVVKDLGGRALSTYTTLTVSSSARRKKHLCEKQLRL
jgi:hypothetical protein